MLPAAASSASPKAYGCPAYPRVLSWGIISHHKTIRFVRNYHGGDWAPYHEKWKKRLGLLEMAHAQGRAVVFPNRIGLRLRGRGLAEFIEMIRKRIDVNLCLAEQAVEVSPGALADFATAAGPATGTGTGTDAGVPLKADATAASGAIDLLWLRVDTECTDGAAVFKVINIGGRWPRPGTFTIYTLDGQKRVSKRRMLLTHGQRASFKFKTRKTGEMVLGLWVDPSWYSRDFRYDAKVICGRTAS